MFKNNKMKIRIKELRKKRKLTLQALADKVGTTNQQIYYLESGQRGLDTKWMERIAKALEVRPQDLISDGLEIENNKALENAHEQLDSAITLWIQDAPNSSIYALAHAAYDYIQNLNNKNEGDKNSISQKIKAPPVEQLIFGCIIGLMLMGEKLSRNQRIFYCWYLIKNPKAITENERTILMQIIPAWKNTDVKNIDKRRFFHSFSGEYI